MQPKRVPKCVLLDRAWRRPEAPADRAIGLRKNERYVVAAAMQRFERFRCKLGRAGESESQEV